MKFECDDHKSESNKSKHGIDSRAAEALWQDSDRVEVPARTEDEPRLMVIGRIGDRVWSAVITYRGESVRMISVQPASRKEIPQGEQVIRYHMLLDHISAMEAVMLMVPMKEPDAQLQVAPDRRHMVPCPACPPLAMCVKLTRPGA